VCSIPPREQPRSTSCPIFIAAFEIEWKCRLYADGAESGADRHGEMQSGASRVKTDMNFILVPSKHGETLTLDGSHLSPARRGGLA